MKKITSLSVLSATVMAAVFAFAAEPGGGVPDGADVLLGDIAKAEKAEAEAATLAVAKRYRWDCKESVADYAKRVGIKDVQTELDLGGGVSLKLTLIPAGTFMMGARPPEFAMIEGVRTVVREGAGDWYGEPQLEVTLSKPFYMGVYEVTREQWEQVMGKNFPASVPLKTTQLGLSRKQLEQIFGRDVAQSFGPGTFLSPEQIKKIFETDPGVLEYFNCKTLPATRIQWEEAVEFCKRVSAKTGMKVSLPTQAQWEFACRAGTDTQYSFGDDDTEMRKYANYNEAKPELEGWPDNDKETTDGFIGPAPVGSFLPNKWGLYDMHGNVWEACHDWAWGYKKSGKLDPTGPDLPVKGQNWHVGIGGGYGSKKNFQGWAGNNTGHGGGSHMPGSGFRVVVALK